MLSTTQASPHARLLLAKRSLRNSTISPATVTVVGSRNRHQQRRAFRFGPWSSFTECDVHREAKRRHRLFRHRQMELLHRWLSWENGPRDGSGNNHKDAVYRAMAGFSQTRVVRKGQYTTVNEIKSWSDGVSGTTPDKPVDVAEREAINHLFGAMAASNQSTNPVDPQVVIEATSSFDANGRVIDPLATRSGSTPQEKRKRPRATTTRNSAAAAATTPKYDDLGKYAPAQFDNPNAPRELTAEEKSKSYSDLGQYSAVKWNEPDGLQKPTAEELSKNYTDLDEYKASKLAEEAAKAIAREQPAKPYNDLDKYKPVEWNEPDGLPGMTAEEKTKLYEDLGKYGPVKWNEPDGLPGLTAEERTKFYQDLDKYEKPVVFSEPDGLRKLTPEEESKNYDDLETYAEGFMAKDSVLNAYEAAQMDTTVKGNVLPEKTEFVGAKDPKEEYTDLGEYGPVKWNEPDGLRQLTPEEKSKKYEDLDNYRQYENDGPQTERIHPEEASKKYKDLKEYGAFPNNGPEVERVHPEEASKQYADLNKYPTAGYEEPAVTEHVHPEELTKNYTDLSQYRPKVFDSPDEAYPMHPEEATKAYNDLHLYKAEQDKDAALDASVDSVAASLKDFDLKAKAKADAAAASTTHRRAALEKSKSEHDSSWDAIAESARQQTRGHGSGAAAAEHGEAELSSLDESFPSANHISKGDPYSTVAQGLETSFKEEVGNKSTGPTVVKHYEATAESAAADAKLAQYKILAYDSATQTVNIAETSSSVADGAQPITPAEAVLRLANPSKFFPFFRSLQDQGYEIVSGSNDVLIFRKVRESASGAASESHPRRKRSLTKKLVLGTAGIAGGAYAIGVLGELFTKAGI